MNNVLSVKFNIYRNLKDYKFTRKLTDAQKEEIKEKLSTFLPKTNDVVVSLFADEHITISAIADDFESQSIDKAIEFADMLAGKLNLAYNDEYGYLMSDVKRIGAGVGIECELCLPCIKNINKIDQVKQNIRNLGYNLVETKMQNVFKLSTSCNLGFTQKEILENFKNTASKLQDLEVECAKMLDVASHDELLDKTYRSQAILSSAYLLSYDELNNILSNLRTGVNLGFVDISEEKIKKLQTLANQNKDFVSASELKNLALSVKEILKGE